jgi:sarcosine oxidase delta subunit
MFKLVDLSKITLDDDFSTEESECMDDAIIADYAEKCTLCGKKFKHFMYIHQDDKGLEEVEIITNDASCRNLLAKRDKLRNEIFNIEFDIIRKRNNKNKALFVEH